MCTSLAKSVLWQRDSRETSEYWLPNILGTLLCAIPRSVSGHCCSPIIVQATLLFILRGRQGGTSEVTQQMALHVPDLQICCPWSVVDVCSEVATEEYGRMAAIHLTSIMFSKDESDTAAGQNCPKQRKPLLCAWREILTRRRRGLEECWRMTQLVRLAPLAPMHVNCRQSFPARSSHTASGKKGGVVRALPDSPMGTLGSSSASTDFGKCPETGARPSVVSRGSW